MLSVKALSAGYGRISVLQDIHIQVDPGEIVAILGPNGAGKSTMLKCIAGVHNPEKGQLELFDESMLRLNAAQRIRRGLGAIPEGRQLFPDMTVRENLILGAYARLGITIPSNLDDDLESVFALFPRLRDRQKQLAGSMSGGEAQMLAIARALMGRPKILLCDEPSLGLAPMMVREMLTALTTLKSQGIAVLIADQNAVAVLELADRGYILDTGRIVAHGASRDLLADSRLHEAYLGFGPQSKQQH
jgi:branched-chain amino acid transport system ATP-binding protein